MLYKLFGVSNINNLSKSDKYLYNDILRIKYEMSGGGSQVGYAIRPDLGEINGMSMYSGYEVHSAPIYVDKLLRFVSTKI